MLSSASIDQLETTILEAEGGVARLRAVQLDALRQLDEQGVVNIDGARSLADWTAARLDVAPETARALVQASRLIEDDDTGRALQHGDMSFDRALATARLAASGVDRDELAMSAGQDISGVRRMTARQRRFTRLDERQVFAEQHLVLQPNTARWMVSVVAPSRKRSNSVPTSYPKTCRHEPTATPWR